MNNIEQGTLAKQAMPVRYCYRCGHFLYTRFKIYKTFDIVTGQAVNTYLALQSCPKDRPWDSGVSHTTLHFKYTDTGWIEIDWKDGAFRFFELC
jgi:hypothetical protein